MLRRMLNKPKMKYVQRGSEMRRMPCHSQFDVIDCDCIFKCENLIKSVRPSIPYKYSYRRREGN